jgi:hypothetical protein
MLDNGRTALGGKLWFVSAVANVGVGYEYGPCEDAELFDLVTDEHKLGSVPAVIYDPRVGELGVRFYPAGLEQADGCVVLPLVNPIVSVEDVFAVVDRVYETVLITPIAQGPKGKLWSKASAGWVVEDAELLIQMHLITALNTKFTDCTIRPEQHQVSGRLDIEIEGPGESGSFHRHVVIELKVLRDFGVAGGPYSPRKTSRWINDGVDQAYAYAAERKSLAAALCCFDMRPSHLETKTAYSAACQRKAKQLDVTLGYWYLFSNLKDYRAHLVSQAIDD